MKKGSIKIIALIIGAVLAIAFGTVMCSHTYAASKPKVSSFTEINADASDRIKVIFKAKNTKSYKVWISTKKTAGFKKVSFKKKDNGKKESLTIKKIGTKSLKANQTYYVKITLYSAKKYKGIKTTKIYEASGIKVGNMPDL